MGGNNVKPAPDAQTDVSAPLSPLYKPHLSPSHSPCQDAFFTPVASPTPESYCLPKATGPAPEEHVTACNEEAFVQGWGAPFSQALGDIRRASTALDQMHSQLRGLLKVGNGPDGPQILDSALGWEARLTEVREVLKGGLKELTNLQSQYEAARAGQAPIPAGETSRVTQEPSEEPIRAQHSIEDTRLRERVRHLEAERVTLTDRITELQGKVQDLTHLQSDLRIAVSVAERFREEAQEKLERSEQEHRRLRAQGSDTTDWTETSPVNGALHGYRSLPRGVILSAMREPIVKSHSLMSVPPGGSPAPQSDAARRERRGSLETLLNQPKPIANLTEDSGSFFRRYGGSKRGVFLRWAQERTCGYKHVVITNFSSSWADGMALCALLHSYLPDRILYSQLRPLEKRKNLQLAFQVAESVGIPPVLSADHMLQTQGPDWQKVLLYVESIYQKFEA